MREWKGDQPPQIVQALPQNGPYAFRVKQSFPAKTNGQPDPYGDSGMADWFYRRREERLNPSWG